MITETASTIFKKRRVINILLFTIFLILFLFYLSIFLKEYKSQQAANFKISSPTEIIISKTGKENKENIILKKTNNNWLVTKPYQNRASFAVINAIIGNLNTGCSETYSDIEVDTEYFATIHINSKTYNKSFQIGEVNPSSDKVFIKENNTIKLCDKVLASIALAPAINFMDRRLFIGELISIKTEFTEMTDKKEINSIDFSVIGIARTTKKNIENNFIGKLIFKTKGDKKETYNIILDSESQQILLIKDNVIYAISNNTKLTNLMGL